MSDEGIVAELDNCAALVRASELRGKRIFVSGGAGVIGRELVPLLDAAGADILVGDLEPRPRAWPSRIHYRRGDLNEITTEELEAFAPEVYFHLAATFERSTETPAFFAEGHHHNVSLSHHLISCLSSVSALRRVVFASSYLIYDPALYTSQPQATDPTLLEENTAIRPRNLCGSAKHHHELELEFLASCPDARFTSVSARIFRSYGRGSRDVISRWVRALFAGDALEVYGEHGRFDYIFAGDVARGLIALATSDARGVVNLGTGVPRSVAEVVEVLRHHFPSMKTRIVDTEIDCEAAGADTKRLREVAGWTPETSLEAGVAHIIDFERERLRDAPEAATADEKLPADVPTIPRNVLIMSVSKKIPLVRSVRRALTKFDPDAQVHGADSDPEALGLHFVDVFWNCPQLSRLSVECLLEHCQRNAIRYIVPTRDAELTVFANLRSKLALHGIEVLVSSPSSVAHCVDKLRFARLLDAAKLPAIETSEVIEALDGVERFVVKDRYGSGSKNLYCNVSRADAQHFANGLVSPIYQPFIEGREYSVDLYRDRQGRVQGTVCRTRDSVVGGESQITTLVNSPVLRDLCVRVVDVLDFWGHATLQAIESSPGTFQLLECNARFGGASTLSDQAGLESFYWFLLEANGEDLQLHPFSDARSGLKLVRHAADHFVAPSVQPPARYEPPGTLHE